MSLVDLKGQKSLGFSHLSAGTRACQKVIFALCASSDYLNTGLISSALLVDVLLLNFGLIRVTSMLPAEAGGHFP